MAINDEKYIRKKYGENMWKLCRRLFPKPLERAELLASILDYYFDHGRGLYDYIEDNNLEFEFQSFVLQKIYPREYQVNFDKPDKTPKELLKEAGYKLYKCESEEEIQKFKKYYTDRESLCTFKGGRLDTSYVYFAVKDNVDEIKREDFTDPKREDLYGTSVLSIQFSKGPSHALSIINRYNHSVDRPNATFGNNLDNIIPGLTASFAHYEGMVQSKIETFEDHMMSGYVQDSKKKFHKILALVDGYAFCENNYIIDMKTHSIDKTYIDKERYIFMDGYILDQKEKKFINYIDKSYYRSFNDANGEIERINVSKESKNNKTITIESKEFSPITIKLDEGKIIYYKNDNVKELGKKFMSSSRYLEEVDLPNVEKAGDGVFENSFKLKTLNMPNVREIGDYFLVNGYDVLNINLNSVEKIGTDFLGYNKSLYKLKLPNVKEIDDGFLEYNEFLEIFEANKLEKMGHSCFQYNIELHKLNLPSLKEMDNYSFNCNLGMETVSLPNLVKMGDNCFEVNKSINFIDLNKVEKIGNNCFKENTELEDFFGPNVEKIGDNFLDRNKILHLFYAPKLRYVGDYFLGSNNGLNQLSLNNLERVGKGFLLSNKVLRRLKMPKVKFNNSPEEFIDSLFLASNIGDIEMFVPLSTKYKYRLMKKINKEISLNGFTNNEDEEGINYIR